MRRAQSHDDAPLHTFAVLCAAALGLLGCGGQALGLEALLRIEGAQYVDGAPPAPSGGPDVASLETTRNEVVVGSRGHVVRGTLPASARGVALSRPGDPGYWVLPAGPPDIATPDLLTFDARAELDLQVPLGALRVEVRATDARGLPGAARALELTALAADPDEVAGELVVLLSWDGSADLDLRVVDPSGVEIGVRNPNAWAAPPPDREPDPSGWRAGATLDVDAQAGCTPTGRQRERVRWPVAPPAGQYVVRVDTYSLCGDAVARWRVSAWRRGALLAEAQGVSTPTDTRFGHDAGAGVRALAFELSP